MKNKKIPAQSEFEKKFTHAFNELCYNRNPWQVWQDFVNMIACSIANAVDRRENVWKQREDLYLEIAKKYQKEELGLICNMFANTVLAMDENPAQDFLGSMYMNLDFGSDWHGQYFTPWDIAALMARMNIDETIKEQIEKTGYISVNDCCCGSGCLLMAFAYTCKNDLGINYQKSVLFTAQDIDPTVAKMCYIQLSLLGCPGYVIIGDSLSEPALGTVLCPSVKNEANIWFTPLYFANIWKVLKRFDNIPAENQSAKPNTIQLMKPKKLFSWKEFFGLKGKKKE